MIAFYIYVPFDVLPVVGFRNNFAIEGGSGVGHLEDFFVSLPSPPCSFFRCDLLPVPDRKVDGIRWGLYVIVLPATLSLLPGMRRKLTNL